MENRQTKWLVWLLYGQSIYFVLTGLWPIFDITSFMAVTGPKQDIWLVQVAGILITAIGISLGVAAKTKAISPPVMTLGVTSALGLMLADVVFYLKGDIPPIYLADALAEFLIVMAWTYFIIRKES
jgi:hypothetical protein